MKLFSALTLVCSRHSPPFSLSLPFQNPIDSPFMSIMRASHVIKGAASNLMCAQLRETAMHLETAASSAAADPACTSNVAVLQSVKARYEDLRGAVQNYHTYLDQVGV
jgi:HPt (histidine-containing phosphotransfer) domain-containing protein